MPLPCPRRLAPIVALLAVLTLTVPVISAAPGRSERVARGYTKLLVATDQARQTRAITQRIERVPGRTVQVLRGPRLLAVRVPRSDAAKLIRSLRHAAGVRFVEHNRVVSRLADTSYARAIPTDPLWPDQWGPALIGAPAAWKLTKGSPSVVIAVLDSGVDSSQPDLRPALVPGYDVVNGDDDPSDDNGHGTRTAGIAGARADNGVGISGVCPGCSIMPVKVSSAAGWSTGLQMASGITWATNHGADVISISLAGSSPSATVASAVNYAESKGVLVVASAGNNGDSDTVYPAGYPGVLSVAGTDPDNKLYPWSNRGSWVAVAAPGCDITTFADGFGRFCGTSASAPVVAGLAGLAFSYAPTASAATVQHAIVSSAHPVEGVAGGRVDAVGTLAALGAKFEPASSAGGSSAGKAARHARSAPRVRHHRRPTPSQAWRPADGVAGPARGAARPGRRRAPLPEGRLRARSGSTPPTPCGPGGDTVGSPTRWPRRSRRGRTPSTSVAVGPFRSRPP